MRPSVAVEMFRASAACEKERGITIAGTKPDTVIVDECSEVDQARLARIMKSIAPDEEVQVSTNKNRNKPCWCGSGKKHKKCCYRSNARLRYFNLIGERHLIKRSDYDDL